LFAALLFVFTTAGPASANPLNGVLGQQYIVSDIIAANGIYIGGILFDSFSVVTTKSSGSVAPDATEISVTPVQISGSYGMQFDAVWNAAGGGLADSTIEFRATAPSPSYAFTGNDLWLTAYGIAGTNPPGIVAVSENLYASNPATIPPPKSFVNELAYYRNDSDNQTSVEGSFAPVTQMWVIKDVGANGGVGDTGVAHLSQFYQTFTQVPEPSTIVLLGIGGLGLLGYVLRRRQG
jgi:hypothetical protein